MKLSSRAVGILGALFLSSISVSALADSKLECFSNKADRYLDVNNEEALAWKGRAGYRDRARVKGTLTRVTQQRKSHTHFEVQVGPKASDTLEIVFNVEFGPLPQLKPGMDVEACGDFIQVGKKSPSSAIVHWVHYNPGDRDGGKHEHGYVVVSGSFFGQTNPKASNLRFF
jgi:hypothetical protein